LNSFDFVKGHRAYTMLWFRTRDISIWKDKSVLRQVGPERLLSVVFLQDAFFPVQQILIVGGEFSPGLSRSRPDHALAN
jgi:hypothetical protein